MSDTPTTTTPEALGKLHTQLLENKIPEDLAADITRDAARAATAGGEWTVKA